MRGTMVIQSFCDIRNLTTKIQDLEEECKKTFGLSLNEAYTLCLLTKHGTLGPKDLVEELKVTPSRVSRIIEALEKTGYLERRLSPGDSRNREIRLTKAGEAFSCDLVNFESRTFPFNVPDSVVPSTPRKKAIQGEKNA
jgi:DNA-binding MarR family transcriptional regulator